MKERYRPSLGERDALHPHNAIRRDMLPSSRGNLLIVDQDYALEAATLRGDNAPIGHTRRFRLRPCARARARAAASRNRVPARAWRTWLFAIARIRYSLPPSPHLSALSSLGPYEGLSSRK